MQLVSTTAVEHLTAETATTLQEVLHFCYVHNSSCTAARPLDKAEGSSELVSPLTPSNKLLHVDQADMYTTLCRKCTYTGAVRQQSSEAAKSLPKQVQPSNLVLVTSFHRHEKPMHVCHYLLCAGSITP